MLDTEARQQLQKDSSIFKLLQYQLESLLSGLYYTLKSRECVSTGARTRRSLGHHLLHPQILRILVLLKLAGFEAQISEQTAPVDTNY